MFRYWVLNIFYSGGSNVGRGGGQSARGSFNAFRGRGGQVLSAGAHAGNVPETTGGSKYGWYIISTIYLVPAKYL